MRKRNSIIVLSYRFLNNLYKKKLLSEFAKAWEPATRARALETRQTLNSAYYSIPDADVRLSCLLHKPLSIDRMLSRPISFHTQSDAR